jgi:hypothetical protein
MRFQSVVLIDSHKIFVKKQVENFNSNLLSKNEKCLFIYNRKSVIVFSISRNDYTSDV